MGVIPFFLAGACDTKIMGARFYFFKKKAPIKLVLSSVQKLWEYIQVIPFSVAICVSSTNPTCRTMLLIMMVIAAGGVPLIENPGSSLLASHDRFRHLVKILKEKGIST